MSARVFRAERRLPMRETKEDRFRRVAEARVNKIIKMIRLLGNCSGTNVYEYSEKQVEQIFSTLQTELDMAMQRYEGADSRKKRRFSLSEDISPTPDTISNPHITMQLPDGTRLRAVAYSDTDYPAINVYLLKDNDSAELICFAEYNPERNPCHEVCVGAYQSYDDETKYYASYEEEGNQDNEITENA
jgi:hypothetical protein